jgi:hypothetical protein
MAKRVFKVPMNVSDTGAAAGSVLRGASQSNQGLRIRISVAQKKGDGGPLVGAFVILDAGDNVHSDDLDQLLERETNAEEVRDLIRRKKPACVNVANRNILVLEDSKSGASGNG